MNTAEPQLRASALSIRLDGSDIVSDVTLDVHPGEILAIIGANGAGKSTLLRGLAGLVPPSHGRVTFGERDLQRLPAPAKAAAVAFVAQDTTGAADLTTRELVLMGRYPHRRRFARLNRADLTIADAAMTDVGVRELGHRAISQLSGGERQLAQIARAVAQQSTTLLLDEPTSALDVHHQLRVFDVLRARADAGTAVGIVLHDLNEAARRADRIAVVHDRRLLALGTPHQILTPHLLAEVYRIEARVHPDTLGYPHVHPLRTFATSPRRNVEVEVQHTPPLFLR